MNLHATDSNGNNYPTKTALRRDLVEGKRITFRSTDMMTFGQHVGLLDIGPADVIVGPDPERNRKWYANIKKGKVV